MYQFSIPDGNRIRKINYFLLESISSNKDWFYNDFKITTAYGCPPSCIWNGGRVEGGVRYSREEIEDLFYFYRQYGIIYRLNFTNKCLQLGDLKDEYGNMIAEIANQYRLKVAVTLPIMKEYLEEKYPNLEITWSTCTNFGDDKEKTMEMINSLSQYSEIVLPYTLNNKGEIANLLYPHNLEILVFDVCFDNCQNRKQHEFLVSKTNRDGVFDIYQEKCLWEKALEDGKISLEKYKKMQVYTNFVKRDSLQWYKEKGIVKFKLTGRTSPTTALVSYNHYFILPKFRDIFNATCAYKIAEMENENKEIYKVPFYYTDLFYRKKYLLEEGKEFSENNEKII